MGIEISPFGSLLVYKKGYTPEQVFKIIKKNNLKGLRIFSVLKEDLLDDIDFLKDYSFLESLDVTSMYDYNFDFLSSLKNLKTLSISNDGKNIIDLEPLVNLKKLVIYCRNRSIKHFNKVNHLEELFLIDYKQPCNPPLVRTVVL